MEMTPEDIKKELKDYIFNLRIIQAKEEEIEEYKVKILSCTSKISDMPKGKGKTKDKIAEYVTIITELEQEKWQKLIELETKKKTIENTINELKQPCKAILYLKYINGNNLTEIAYKLGYEYKWLCKLHGNALEEYVKTRQNATKEVGTRL